MFDEFLKTVFFFLRHEKNCDIIVLYCVAVGVMVSKGIGIQPL